MNNQIQSEKVKMVTKHQVKMLKEELAQLKEFVTIYQKRAV